MVGRRQRLREQGEEALGILVTGTAGFIGYHVSNALLDRGKEVMGLDNLNDYYDVRLKHARLERLKARARFQFAKVDVADRVGLAAVFEGARFERVVHLAAQAGVRYSLVNPEAYIDANVVGFANILEGCRRREVGHLVYASSSSVYGANEVLPFSEQHNVDHPVSLYAATKKANELMAHAYAHLYRLPVTGLRFFTVYGPWGRPDMAYYTFTRKILQGEPIEVFNRGQHVRDFTYIDDAVEGVLRVLDRVAAPDGDWSGQAPNPATSSAPYRLFNIGNGTAVTLSEFIAAIEEATGSKATRILRPVQAGDVERTCADVGELLSAVQFRPRTSLAEGMARFVAWYRQYAAAQAAAYLG
jgi:UDP-glucuronate 4-epimerase